MTERRESYRYAVSLPVQASDAERMPRESYLAELINMSTSGLCFRSDRAHSIGSHVDLLFHLNETITLGPHVAVRALGMIVRIARSEPGVEAARHRCLGIRVHTFSLAHAPSQARQGLWSALPAEWGSTFIPTLFTHRQP